MDFEYQYNRKLDKIEEEIYKVFPEKADRLWIQTVSGEEDPRGLPEYYTAFCRPAGELLHRGGKRWRPVVMLLSCELAGGTDEALTFVPVVEFSHNGSLIIDDIEDHSVRRRGKEAVHLMFGEDLSINAGNMLYFLPGHIIERADIPDSLKVKIYAFYTENMMRLHFGQGLDILWHRNKDLVPLPEEYEQMCRFKTGSLARMAAQIGAASGGGGEKEISLLGSVCEDMGVGFQIMDDVANLTTGNPGKDRGDDIVEGKKSLPVIYHLENNPGDRAVFQELFTQAENKGFSHAQDEIGKAINLMTQSGSIARARERGKKLLSRASERVYTEFGEQDAAVLLREMIQKFAESY